MNVKQKAKIIKSAIAFAGLALVTAGAYLIYPPAGFITCGALLLLDVKSWSR